MSLTVMRKTSLRYTESKVFQTTSGVNHKDNTTDITHGEMDDTNQEKQRNLWSAGRRHLEYKYTILTRAVDQFEILSRKVVSVISLEETKRGKRRKNEKEEKKQTKKHQMNHIKCCKFKFNKEGDGHHLNKIQIESVYSLQP